MEEIHFPLPNLPALSRWPLRTGSVGVKDALLGILQSQLPVCPLQPEPKGPGTCDSDECEGSIARHGDDIFGSVALDVQVGRVDEGSHGDDVDDGEGDGLLLGRLAKRRRHPAQDDRVAGVDARGEHEARDVAGRHVEGDARDDEACEGCRHAHRDVPGAFVEAAG